MLLQRCRKRKSVVLNREKVGGIMVVESRFEGWREVEGYSAVIREILMRKLMGIGERESH